MVVSILIACVLAVVFIAVRITVATKDNVGGVIGVLVKILAGLGFIAVAVTAVVMGGADGAGIKIQSAIFIVAGLVCGLVGDILLDLKVVYRRSKEEGVYLTGGMASFGIGHILYFVGILFYLGSSVISWQIVGICVAVAAVTAFAMVFGGEKIMKLDFGKFTIHSICYAFILVFMTAIGISAWVLTAKTNAHVAVFGSGMILFFLSDVVLTQMYFGGKPTDSALCVINHALYYAAQICVASFLFYMA
jgi:uncharacterized membrane protein YhhN